MRTSAKSAERHKMNENDLIVMSLILSGMIKESVDYCLKNKISKIRYGKICRSAETLRKLFENEQ